MYDERELAAVKEVIESRQWWRMIGTQVKEFEQEFAAYQGARFALGVANGTQAIEVALAALDIEYGDEVIVPAFSFISTATAVLSVNAVPVFVDVDPETYCLSAETIAAAVTPRTRAIIPVHMAGHVAEMGAILRVAREHGLAVIEDAAHAHGAEWEGRRVGALDRASIFSFQAGKLMTAGEGGIILSDDEEYVERCFLFNSCGRPRTDRTYQHSVLASNCRMSEACTPPCCARSFSGSTSRSRGAKRTHPSSTACSAPCPASRRRSTTRASRATRTTCTCSATTRRPSAGCRGRSSWTR